MLVSAEERAFRTCDTPHLADHFHGKVKQAIEKAVDELDEFDEDNMCAEMPRVLEDVMSWEVCKCTEQDFCNAAFVASSHSAALLVVAALMTSLLLY